MIKIIKKHKFIVISLIIAIGIFFFITIREYQSSNQDPIFSKSVSPSNVKSFTPKELKKYDGTNPSLPIYLALDGKVYDVSSGKEYYQVGGSYHSLAGKDSSKELHFAGGSIIKKKYKVIGELKNN